MVCHGSHCWNNVKALVRQQRIADSVGREGQVGLWHAGIPMIRVTLLPVLVLYQ